jgi:DNA-binding transcriptional LysR family regulator
MSWKPPVQIDLIETFLSLIDTRSFHKTAERLSITQSTTSARIQALEASLGARLFTRSRAGTELTTEGLRFEVHARILRQEWNEAKRAVAPLGDAALAFRIGIQNDLAAAHISDLITEFRRNFPQTSFYFEPDYSAQMCLDIVAGHQDFAVLFTPKPHPDLYFSSVGALPYRLISSDAGTRAEIRRETFINAHISPAFEQSHREVLPEFLGASLSVGQSAIISTLLENLGGTGFVMAGSAAEMVASGRFRYVKDVASIDQPIYAALHLRRRTSKAFVRLVRAAQKTFALQPSV